MGFTTKIFALCLLQLTASFDRSAVENQVRYSLGYRGDVEFQPPAAKFKPNFLAQTTYGTYYGAAANPWFLATLPRKNNPDFPQTKAEVQSKPHGISVQNARLAYLKSADTPSLKSANGKVA